jgi:hypothetical protein
MNFLKFYVSAGSPSWPAILQLSTKNNGTIEPELDLPEELELGTFPSPSLLSSDYGSFSSPSADSNDLGSFAP